MSDTEKKAIKLSRLTKDLGTLFLPIIRYRGNRYFKDGRVELTSINKKFVKSRIRGNVFYKVSIDLKEKSKGAVRIGCTCPFFRQGIPCKHIWATIVAAEKYFKEHKDSDSCQIPSLSFREIFDKKEWNTTNSKKTWWPIQDFVLRYELKIRGDLTVVSAYEQYVKKDGKLGRIRKIKPKSLSRPELSKADRLAIPFLMAISGGSSYSYGGYFYDSYLDTFREISLSPEDVATLLPLLAKTQRCMVKNAAGSLVADPLIFQPSSKAKFIVSADESKNNKIILRPRLYIENEPVDFANVLLINSSPAMMIFNSRLYEIDGPSYPIIKKALEKGIEQADRKKMPQIVRRAIEASGLEHLELPKEFVPNTIEGLKPTCGLVLRLNDERLVAEPFFLYNHLRIDACSREHIIFDEKRWTFLKRNRPKEKELLKQITDAGLSITKDGLFSIDISSAPDALTLLDKKGIILKAENGKPFRTGILKRLYISSGIDWFDMDAQVDFGSESVPLPKVISAYLKGKKTIRLNSGGKGILPLKWLKKHIKLLQLAKTDKTESGESVLRFPSSHALLIEHLLEEVQESQADDKFQHVKDRLKNFKGIRALNAPSNFKDRLRPYQKEALGWFSFLHDLGLGGILADDMGLGKTVQILAWLQMLKKNERPDLPSLIVAPTSLIFNWQAEAKRFTPDLNMAVYVGPEREKLLQSCDNTDILLTTYGIVRRDIKTLVKLDFNYCILDESQYIKNPDSLTAKACRLIKARHRLCLTGTPIENHLGELWSQMEFLDPGILGKKEQFMEKFAKPAASGDKEVLNSLKKLVSPFILRRTKEQVAKELPNKIESIIWCTMTSEQQQLYNQVRDHYRFSILQAVETKGLQGSKIKVLEGLLRLRQVANHPALIGEKQCTSGKFQQLLELLSEAVSSGHKVLIFSQFTKMLALIRRKLAEMKIPFEYLDGRTPQTRRKERVRNFQENDKIRVFLISLKAGGFGLNLTAADYVFIVDPWWNPAVEMQAIDRTHRIGQTKKVVTYRLISKDSVEEKVLNLQKKKQEIVSSILSGSSNLLKELTAKDLQILFS